MIEVTGSDLALTYKDTIQTSSLPPAAQGLTGVLCKVCWYMMGQQGMNLGGISVLFNNLLIVYNDCKIGFSPR